MVLKVEKRISMMEEYYCDLTSELDSISGLDKCYTHYKHYILADAFCVKEKCLAIRVPGCTVGGIWIDDENHITKISMSNNYVFKSYPDNINDVMQKYVGTKIEFE